MGVAGNLHNREESTVLGTAVPIRFGPKFRGKNFFRFAGIFSAPFSLPDGPCDAVLLVFLARMAHTACREAPPPRRKRGLPGLRAVPARRDSSTARDCWIRESTKQRELFGRFPPARGQRTACRESARPALGAIQLFRTRRNRMNRQGARTKTVGRSRVVAEVVFDGSGA